MNSCAAICGLEAPWLARRAISASCAVRTPGVPAARLSACAPVARSFGSAFGQLDAAKQQYDPDEILTPGYEIF